MRLSTERFSDRVDNYVKFRPGYPAEIVDVLRRDCGLSAQNVIADIGSGTGLLSDLFLKSGNRVLAVEPNEAMRNAAERLHAGVARFESRSGTAEATGLGVASVDYVVAGQAFHWFEPIATRAEWLRILRPGGWVMLVWNERLVDTTPFLRDYEAILVRYATDYSVVNHTRIGAGTVAAFFAGEQSPAAAASDWQASASWPMTEVTFATSQQFDLAGLRGRVQSSSYMPGELEPNYLEMIEALERLFDQHQRRGLVKLEYATRMYYGQLA